MTFIKKYIINSINLKWGRFFMARKSKKTKKTKKIEEEDEVLVEETEVTVDEQEVTEEKEEDTKEKEVVKLNCVESLAYEGMKSIFVGAFMIGDLLGFYDKKDCDD